MSEIKVQKLLKVPGTNIVLEKGDKIIFGKDKMTEAFAHGTAVNVARKMCAILGRRLNSKFEICSIPSEVSSNQGKYMVYYGCCKGAINRAFSINFFSSKSDEIVGFAFYDDATDPSRVTEFLDLNGFNIVQVLDQIVDFFNGTFQNYVLESVMSNDNGKYRFIERTTLTDMTITYLHDNLSYIKEIENGSFDYAGHIPEFLKYISDTYKSNKSNFKVGGFMWNIKNALEMDKSLKGNAAKVPGISVTTGMTVQSTTPLLNAADEALWKEIEAAPATEKWDNFEQFVRIIAKGVRNAISLIAYGTPGTGKTYNCLQILKEEGTPYTVIGGTVSDIPTILGIIYTHKDDEVIVFDDCDAIFSSGNRSNIFKQLLQQIPHRTSGMNKAFKYNEGGNITEVPATFDVTSRIIVLSNKPRDYFEPALLSRCFDCELLFSKEEMLELIKAKMDKLGKDYPEITLDDKQYIFELLKRFSSKLPEISLRIFVKACQGMWMAREFKGASGSNLDKEILKFIKN